MSQSVLTNVNVGRELIEYPYCGDNTYICNILTPSQQSLNKLIEELRNIEGRIILLDPPAWVAAIVAKIKCQMPNNIVYVIENGVGINLSTVKKLSQEIA